MGEVIRESYWQAVWVMAPPIPLVWAKLRPPVLPVGAVERPELIETLIEADAALTAIVAPPGYGKTTAAVQLVVALDQPFAWLSLEPADATPARFWTYVAAAFHSAGVEGAAETYRHLVDDGIDAAALALRAAVESHGQPIVLVLDDMHAIDHPEIERQLGEWLRHPVANLRLVCTSRSDLALPVGRLRSQGLLTEARIGQLAFTADESATLLRVTFGLDELTAAQLAALAGRTEGWPVGVYLAGLTLRDDPDIDGQLARFAGDTRHLTEYLSAEAMDGVTEDVRAFVLATSVVNVLDPDLCDTLTGNPGSLRTLRGLVANNVFTSALDAGGTLFHYHPLFREHLRSALASEHPDEVRELHSRASGWFEANGDVDEAIVHATAAGDIERAEKLIVSTSLFFSNAGHFETVINWVAALGEPSQLRTETCLIMSWTMLNLRQYDELERWIVLSEQSARSEIERHAVARHIPTLRSHRARHTGDVGAMVQHAREAVDDEPHFPTPEEAGSLFLRPEAGRGAAQSALGSALFWAGEADSGTDYLLDALATARSANVLIEVIFCYCYLAIIAAEDGDADSALAHADQALALVGPGQERHLQPSIAYLARSMANLSQGRPSDATVDLDRARGLAAIRTEPLVDAAIELHGARVYHRMGGIEAARRSVRTTKAMVAQLPDAQFDARIRAVEAEIRFVARDVEDLPIGARELTDRELAVLALLPHDLKRKELAEQLHVSENTIKTHLTSIRHKLGVSGRESIVDRATELGLFGSVG
jgi:LuxR family maltose regulon positive regulatory protein